MKIFLGTSGLNKTWQKNFTETVKCHKCKGNARIMFVGFEGVNEKSYISSLHKNEGKKGYWVHDAVSVANYLCPQCFEVTAVLNQA